MSIRHARESDLDQVMGIMIEHYLRTGITREIDIDKVEEYLRACIHDPDVDIIVAKDLQTGCCGGVAIAYIVQTWYTQPDYGVDFLYVMPQYRREGYGRNLRRYMVRRAQDLGCGGISASIQAYDEAPVAVFVNGWAKHGLKPAGTVVGRGYNGQ